jgi:hypothetical protein
MKLLNAFDRAIEPLLKAIEPSQKLHTTNSINNILRSWH